MSKQSSDITSNLTSAKTVQPPIFTADDSKSLDSAELISSPVDGWTIIGREDLQRQLSPFRVVDAINPALRLDNHAAILHDVLCAFLALFLITLLLRRLDGEVVHLGVVAGIDLQSGHVGRYFEADTGCAGVHADDGDQRVRSCVLRGSVDEPAGIVAGAVCAAHTVGILEIGADELALGEIGGAVERVYGKDGAVGDEDAICGDKAVGVRELQEGVIQDIRGLEGIEVPVDVVREHDGSRLRQGKGDQFGGQLRETLWVLRSDSRVDTVHGVGDDVSGEVLPALIEESKGDGRLGVCCDSPVPLVVAHLASVESISAVVLILRHMVLIRADGERAVLDAIGVPTHNSTEEGVDCLCVIQVGLRIIVANDDILLLAIAIRDHQRYQPCSIWNQLGSDVFRADGVDLEGICS